MLTLLLAVDDATGTVPYALFREQEDTRGYLLLLRGVIEQWGMPLAVYTDRHTVFGHWRAADPTRSLPPWFLERLPSARGRCESSA